jgi:hypothetical protein
MAGNSQPVGEGLDREVPARGRWVLVANPDLTVVETKWLKRVGHALDEFLDKINE